jgi:hypothetical protein
MGGDVGSGKSQLNTGNYMEYRGLGQMGAEYGVCVKERGGLKRVEGGILLYS